VILLARVYESLEYDLPITLSLIWRIIREVLFEGVA
jgi:hypothetical protein